MELYSLLNAALLGFFGFAAIYFSAQWWQSRSEQALLAFALHCAVCAAFCPSLILLAHAATVPEAQFASDWRTGLGLLAHATALVTLICFRGGRRRRVVAAAVIGGALSLAAINLFTPLTGEVLALQRMPLPGGGIATPIRGPSVWWLPLLYLGIAVIYLYGLIVARALWPKDRTGAVLVGAASVLNIAGPVVLGGLIDIAHLRAPYLGALPQAFFVCCMVMVLSREYAARGARIASTERRFATAFELAPIGMALVSPEGRWLKVNQALCRMLGYSREELHATTFQALTHPDDLHTNVEQVQRLLAGEIETYLCEKRYFHASGHNVWTHVSVSLVRDAQGQPVHFVCQIQDITERIESQRERERLIHDLGERVKEQCALHAAAGVLCRPDQEVEVMLAEVVSLLPAAFQFPEVAAARIRLGSFEAVTARFVETSSRLTVDFESMAGPGCIEVVYLDERPPTAEGPFLSEERDLLTSLSEMIRTSWESRLREEARRRHEARFRGMFERAAIGVALVDPGGRLIEGNAALSEMLGYTSDELRSLTFVELTHPADGQADLALFEELMERSRDSYQMEKRYLRKDGSVFWGKLTVSLIPDEQGRPNLAIGMVEDISLSKRAVEEVARSEERYRSLVSATSQVVWNTGPDGRVMDDLPTWRAFTGQTLEELLRPGGWLEAIHSEDRDHTAEAWAAAVKTGAPFQCEYRVRRADGSYRHLAVRGVPVRDALGDVREWVGAGTDVTETIRLQAQFLQAQKLEAVGRLAGGVAHDFNNMLQVINGFTELSLTGISKNDPRRDYLAQVLRAGERAHALVRQLLVFSRQEVVRHVRVRLNDLVADMQKMLRSLIGEDVAIELQLETEAWDVKADPGQVEQVVMNLAVNARDAMPSGGKILLETRNVTLTTDDLSALTPGVPAGQYVMLGVTDSGTGIDPEVLQHIFEPFFTTKPKGVGTGLGLATVFGIVEGLSGALRVVSEPGKGASFQVYFPRLEIASASPTADERPAAEGGDETILFVEDEPMVRAVLRSSLHSLGYTVLEASGGEEAFEHSARHLGPIHLLLTDVVMPEWGGRQIAERIQAERGGIRVLYMSGYTGDGILRAGLQAGEIQLLQKPFTPTSLARKVREALDAPP